MNPAAPPATAGLLGCGVMAGIGAAMLTGNVQRGDTVAVFGCGGVGDAAIIGRQAGRGDDDRRRRPRRHRSSRWAKEFGATHTVNAGERRPGRRRPGGDRTASAPTSCIEAVGNPKVLEQAFFARDLAGTVVQVGVPTPDMTFPTIPMIEFFGRGGALKPSWYGDCLPSRDFPMLIDLYLQGRLDLDRFVSETIALDDVEEAFHKMERGEVLRSRGGALMDVELVTTDGIFSLDGGEWEVTNNIWLVGDDREVLVVDAAHDAERDRRRGQRSAGDGDRPHPRPQRPHQRRARAAGHRRRADLAAPRRPDAVGGRLPRHEARPAGWSTARC